MGRAQGHARASASASRREADAFGVVLGHRRGTGGWRDGSDLPPAMRLAFVREQLAAGDLRAGFLWRSEVQMRAALLTDEKRYGLSAWWDTVRAMLARQTERELGTTAGALAMLGFEDISWFERRAGAASIVKALHNGVSVTLDRVIDRDGLMTPEQAQLQSAGWVSAEVARRVAAAACEQGAGLARCALGARRYQELKLAIARNQPQRAQRELTRSAVGALRHSWRGMLAYAAAEAQALQALPGARAKAALRDVLLAGCYRHLEIEAPAGS